MNCLHKLFILSLLALVYSCSDFIEPKSHSEVIPKTAGELNELLMGQAYPTGGYLVSILAIMDDDVTTQTYSGFTESEYEPAYSALSAYTWQPNYYAALEEKSMNANNLYSRPYNSIAASNSALDYIDEVSGTETEKNNVRAQAHAMRALMYFGLVNTYGEPYNYNPDALGIPLLTSSAVSNNPVTRNTVEQAYTLIENDLLKAIAYYQSLPVEMRWSRNYRSSLPMAQLLLSRVYLYMEKWSLAAYYAEQVIEQTEFPELKLFNLNNLPEPTQENPYFNFISYSNPESILIYGSVSDVVAATTLSVYPLEGPVQPYYIASDELLDLFTPTDLRRDAYLVQNLTTGLFWAYGKVAILPGDMRSPNTAGTNSGLALRLAEAYLNYAEANAMLYLEGSDYAMGEALKAMNQLRYHRIASSAYSPETFMSAEELLQFVRDERRRELCFENHRWFDLRRYGMPEITHSRALGSTTDIFVLEKNDPGYTLRLPDDAIENNSHLTPSPLFPIREPR